MKSISLLCSIFLIANTFIAADDKSAAVEHINRLAGDIHPVLGVLTLKGTDRITTKESFKPPVEIVIICKTDSTNLRMAYAADQVIFNWEVNNAQLRIDGGPASGKNATGSGQIPKNKFVSIKWVVLPDQQQIFVDGDLRFEHKGDYSTINRPVSVFCNNSKVTVKSIIVRDLSTSTKQKE